MTTENKIALAQNIQAPAALAIIATSSGITTEEFGELKVVRGVVQAPNGLSYVLDKDFIDSLKPASANKKQAIASIFINSTGLVNAITMTAAPTASPRAGCSIAGGAGIATPMMSTSPMTAARL